MVAAMSSRAQNNQQSLLKPTGVYLVSCPNCGGAIADDRLYERLPCPKCLPEKPVKVMDITDIAELLAKNRILREKSDLSEYARIERESREVESLFEKTLGSKPWSAQRSWIRRVLKHKSFAIIAPTGVGKTTFGVLMAIYFAGRGYKSYIVVPTTPLVEMVEEKAIMFSKRSGIAARIIAIHSRLRGKNRIERMEKLRSGDFDILITTSRFLIQHADEIAMLRKGEKTEFYFVFVDDVDAVLKSGKSVDSVLKIIGFSDDDIRAAWELLKLRRELPRKVQEAQRILNRELEKIRLQLKRRGGILTAEEIRAIKTRVFKQHLGSFYEKINTLEDRIKKAREKASVLVVSSATGRPRGSRIRLFSILLGFQAGSRSEVLRNIVDAYVVISDWNKIENKLIELVKRLGSGGLIYVPIDKGSDYAEELAKILNNAGIKAEAFTSRNVEALERFQRGELDVLVGVAIYYGVAVRGLDLPERIRYAIFIGVPRLKFSARFEDPHPLNIIRILALLADNAPKDVAKEAEARLVKLRRIMQKLSQAALSIIAEELRAGTPSTDYSRMFYDAAIFIRQALSRTDVWEALSKAPDIAIVVEDGRNYILIPDVATYIQASGRTSRLVAGGLTKGLSIVLADNGKLMEGLIRRSRWYADAEWKHLDEINLDEILLEVDKDRRRVREVLEGKIRPEVKETVRTALLIVESPNKARTIANFFGKPSVQDIGQLRVYEVSTGDYTLLITASGGHIYDLVKPYSPAEHIDKKWLLGILEGSVDDFDWSSAQNIDGVLRTRKGNVRFLPIYAPLMKCMVCGYQWTLDPTKHPSISERVSCPNCGSMLVKSSIGIVNSLRDVASEVDIVMIGTDPDTEGEKIGWDLAALVAPAARSILRVEFHEITRKAILRALKEARDFNRNLIEAQIVRRVEDRWIGFRLSPVLWKYFWPEYCKKFIERLEKKRLMLEEQKSKEQDKQNRHKEKILRSGEKDNLKVFMKNFEKYYEKIRESKEKMNSIKEREEKIRRERDELEKYCNKPNYNLSAGRVQTPVLGWIVEHTLHYRYEKQYVARLPLMGPENSRLELEVSASDYDPKVKKVLDEIARTIDWGLKTSNISRALEILKGSNKNGKGLLTEVKRLQNKFITLIHKGDVDAYVDVIAEEEFELKPLPPYTTDTMLSEASNKLGLGAPEIMKLAQDLFELGFITYHRTDSTRISDVGISVAREYLSERYGDLLNSYFVPRTWGEGGAHEAIRPTRPIDAERLRRLIEEGVIQPVRPLTRRHYALYDLIFRRFIASQMKPARIVKQKLRVKLRIGERVIEKEIERYVDVKEPGFLEIYIPIRIEARLVPGHYELDKTVNIRNRIRVRSTTAPLTQADAIRLMKERNIGRPSTYAKIIDTLLRRAYVVSRARGILLATERGIAVYEFLMRDFGSLVSEEVTRKLQEIMDMIEQGREDYQAILEKIIVELDKILYKTYPEFAPLH